MSRTVKAGCMLCEAVCGLEVELEGRDIGAIRGDADDPFSRGHICPKAVAIKDVMADPNRVREPQKRVGGRFESVSWSEALTEAGRRIAEVQAKHGRDAIAVYLGNPTVHSHGALLATAYFGKALGTRSKFSATSIDQLPHMLAALEMFGHQLLLPVPDVDRTDYLLMIGANPLASNGSLMTAPGIEARLEAIKARGGKLVVVDPRRTETAAMASEHLPIRPGRDVFLLLGLLDTLFSEKLVALGSLASFTHGTESLGRIVQRFPAERVAPITGVPVETIRRIARELAGAKRAAIYGRMGACTQEFGGLTAWLINVLNVVTGNLDRVGGMMFTRPAADLVQLASRIGHTGHFDLWRSRLRQLPEFGGELPAAVLAEEMETPGPGQIKALITFAGNPVLSAPNGRRIEAALKGLELMISIDIYKNETTSHAHYILPTTFGFERDHFDLAFYALAVRNVARFTPAFVDAPAGVRDDFWVLLQLARSARKHGAGKRSRGLDLTLLGLEKLGPKRLLDLLLRTGPHRSSLSALLEKPSGIDFGALEPCLPERLGHRDGKIHLVPECFEKDLARVDRVLEETPPDSLVLIGRRQLRSNNSWLHNSARLMKGSDRCTLIMHPEDAQTRGLHTGSRVSVRSRVGEVQVGLELSDEMTPGVVSLPHGFGHARDGVELDVARASAGVSINDLTDESRVDPLSGVAVLNGVPVVVQPAIEHRSGRAELDPSS